MESSKQIEDAAAVWLQRRDSDEWSYADQIRLNQWLDSSIAHRVAYLRLEAAWEQAERLQALGAGTRPGTIPPPGEWSVSPLFEQRQPLSSPGNGASSGEETDALVQAATPRMRFAAIAATVVVALGIIYFVGAELLEGDRYMTPVGGMASIPLEDGSKVTLNTSSDIRVSLNKEKRLIKLQSGEAFFDVAKDPDRPFIVEAGGKRVVVIGTQFSVRRDGSSSDIQVVVTDGKVRLEGADVSPQESAALTQASDAKPVRSRLLAAGAVAHTVDRRLLVQEGSTQAAEQALSWRTGYLTFDSTSLADAVAEFNRYTDHKIQIQDPHLAGLRISGKFRTTNAEAFIRVLRDGFNIQAQQTDGRVMLSQS